MKFRHLPAIAATFVSALGPGLLLILLSGLAFAAESEQSRYQALLSQITELEARVGLYDPTLVEDLVTLADSATELHLYSEASSLLNRAIQIERLNNGLFAPEQIPLHFALIASQGRSGDWTAATDSMEHLYWLLLEKQAGGADQLVERLARLGGHHLEAIGGDAPGMRAPHFQHAEELAYMALKLSESTWRPDDPRRIELYYSLLKQFYLQSVAIERRDETGYALRAVVPGSTWVRSERISQMRYYRAGLRLFRELKRIYAGDGDDNAELLAMFDLYRADWQLIFDREQARDEYRQAFTSLQDAGVDAESLNRLFARPRIVPLPTLFPSVSQALAADGVRQAANAQASTEAEQPFGFQEWYAGMPFVPFPENSLASPQRQTEVSHALQIRFRLNGLQPVSRWVGGTYETHLSVAEEFTFLNQSEELAIDDKTLTRQLHLLRFRPRLVDGEAQPFEGTLHYQPVASPAE